PRRRERESVTAPLAFRDVRCLTHADVGVQPFGAPTREFETDVAAPRRRKHEHLFLVHFLAKPRHELLDVSHEPLGLHGRGDNLRIVHEVSLARTSLIPMHDREVLLQPMRGKPCHRCGWKARSTKTYG